MGFGSPIHRLADASKTNMRLAFTMRVVLLSVLVVTFGLASCDTGITGEVLENAPPDTELSVRDTSLVDNLSEADRLTSTVLVSWSGTDPDGFVSFFELRFFNQEERLGAEEGWVQTASSDTLVLLPIPQGERAANVVFEVRAIDNNDAQDPTPARTVFPIQNSPPTIRLTAFEEPPDTTFTVFSFSWRARDPDGDENLDRIEVSFNDSTEFVSLPADADFVTFVADVEPGAPAPEAADARVFLGRGFQGTTTRVPGLQIDNPNTFYLRAVDQTDTTSTLERFDWFVKQPQGQVLYVNDYRNQNNRTVQAFHLDLLRAYLPPDVMVETWDISMPFTSGSQGSAPRSDALPPVADPTLRQTFTLFDFVYWVGTSSTNRIQGNNLPLAANVMDLFFENGGTMMVHTPISLPNDPEDNVGNAAILLLPLTDLIAFPDSLREQLRLQPGAEIQPVQALPGLGQPLPLLEASAFLINTLPYITEGANTISLYEAAYQYVTRAGNRRGAWTGPSTVASISADQRVGLMALPLINDQTGELLFQGTDGDPEASIRAMHLMLESLGFPKR